MPVGAALRVSRDIGMFYRHPSKNNPKAFRSNHNTNTHLAADALFQARPHAGLSRLHQPHTKTSPPMGWFLCLTVLIQCSFFGHARTGEDRVDFVGIDGFFFEQFIFERF